MDGRKGMAEGRTLGMFVRDSVIVLAVIAGAVGIYRFKHHESVRNHVGVVAGAETLNVAKGTERYHVEPGKDYVPVSEKATFARIESADGNWFAVSNRNGTLFRDCATEPLEITVANNPETSRYRVRVCGGGRRLTMTGR
jgi:hypothetical protein